MRKSTFVLIVVSASLFAAAVVGGGSYLAIRFLSNMPAHGFGRVSTNEPVDVDIPKGVNEQTLAVFNFRPHGDADARPYAIGFARALADRLYCAPTAITQQMTTWEITSTLCARKLDPRKPVADDAALAAGRKMDVCWVVTGDMYRSGGQTKLAVNVTDTRSGRAILHKVGGANDALGTMQAQVIGQIIKDMGLKLTHEQVKEVSSPNFGTPRTLDLYGRSFMIDDVKQCEALRWQAVEGDPGATFPILRLLEFYYFGGATIPEMQSNKRLASLIDETEKRFPTNSHMSVTKGLLLVKECRYAEAEARLRKLVEDDPSFVRGHTALAYVAECRWDGRLGVAECTKLVKMWPNNAYLHALLAQAYNTSASNARRGHYFAEMTSPMREAWEANCDRALTEAKIAVKMDRDCYEGWRELMTVGLQLSRSRDVETAFNEKVRINPRNEGAYRSYASCFTPQWGGTEADRERIYSQAEAVFGKDSPEVCAIRASTMLGYPAEMRPRDEILRNIELGLKHKGSYPGLVFMKSKILFGLKRYDESEAMAVDGIKRWNTLDWRFHLARCYAMRYQNKGDRQALDKAAGIFAEYAHELPNNPQSYIQWGWCLSHQGHRSEAKAKFLKALELDPTNESAKDKMKYVQ